MKQDCPNCGAKRITTRTVVDEFKYGCPKCKDHYGKEMEVVALKAEIPVRTCVACGFEYTDYEAEDIREKAIQTHLSY